MIIGDNVRQKSVDMGLRPRKNMYGWVGFFSFGPHTPVTFLDKYPPRGSSQRIRLPFRLASLNDLRPSEQKFVLFVLILFCYCFVLIEIECVEALGLTELSSRHCIELSHDKYS